MVLRGWLLLLLSPAVVVHTQDATDACKSSLGLSSGSIGDDSISSPLGDETTPSAGRLGNENGAWCFDNDSLKSQNAYIIIDMGRKRFVSGFGSQGPPEGTHPKSYKHVIAFLPSYSMDQISWENFNGGNMFFNADKDDTVDAISYHMSSTVAFTQYVKLNVTMQVSGSTRICLRFELYGCDIDVEPKTDVQAVTTLKGKVEVQWKQPTVENSLDPEDATIGVLNPDAYTVLYRPMESETMESEDAASSDRMVSLEDVRLGATYVIQLKCIYKDVIIKCGSTKVDAYPPCPDQWTAGNEHHCFVYINPASSFDEARTTCLNFNFDQKLGNLGYIVDEGEERFLVSRILPKDTSEVWLIGNLCQENEDCCRILKVNDDTLEERSCNGEELQSAICLRDHKGEGARFRISSVESSNDGSSAFFKWRYEGIGWKTDELQVKMWKASEGDEKDVKNPSILKFSTLSGILEIKAEVGIMYSILLKPAPNIRTEEFVYKFIIIDFQDGTTRYGAILTPVPMSVYIIWSGTLRVTWDEVQALSKTGEARSAEKYSITYQMAASVSDATEIPLESKREFQLTPIEMQATYVFKLECYFADAFQPCGQISITTNPPDLVLHKPSKDFVIYETIQDKMKTWSEAEEDCQQRAGHLTSLLDDAEAKALLKMLPSRDAKMWTGAKLGWKSTGYWTDGEKITELPMAKNSGVTSTSESCCKAINEMGKLRLTGGSCKERHPYICKYTVQEILTVPGNLKAKSRQWNSFEVSWLKTTDQWLPTFYNVRACPEASQINCIENELKSQWSLQLQNLKDFQNYVVDVEAVLQPVDIKTVDQIKVMTYPKTPVRINIGYHGKCMISTPMLVAEGYADATVTVMLSQLEATIATINGGVKDLEIPNLAPEEEYQLIVKQDGGEWKEDVTFKAVPTCPGRDELVGSNCYSVIDPPQTFEEAKKQCLQFPSSEEKNPMHLWVPLSDDDLKTVVTSVRPYSNVWVDTPKDGSISNIGSDSGCSEEDASACCFYDVTQSNLVCSGCCDQKMPFVCKYMVKKAYLGTVVNLLPVFIGNVSVQVQWGAPDDIFWSIKRYDVEWRNVGQNGAIVGQEVVVGITEKKIADLEYGTEYEIAVTCLGAASLKGDTERILITTLDPRTPIVINIDSDGTAKAYSPLLIDKGRGSEEVEVKVFKMDDETKEKVLQYTVSGKAENVAITDIEIGKEYSVEMKPKVQEAEVTYSKDFSGFPSCAENQIQDGPVCIWVPPGTKTRPEALEACRNDNGELLDYKTQEGLRQSTKILLISYLQQGFWLDTTGSTNLGDADASCNGEVEMEARCCSYALTEKGAPEGLTCTCCKEPRPFACKKLANIKFCVIGGVTVNDITATSLTLSWTMASTTKWQKPSFLVTWNDASNRQKRQADNQLVTNKAQASVNGLKPSTKYKVVVAPYVKSTEGTGDPKEVTVETSRDNDVLVAGFTQEEGCTILILKISCCITVILGSSFTVFVFIATRMFYLDCLAQMFAELGILGAYMCVLISSAQSYNDDSQCLRAHPNLCVAVSVLIQFFFQVVFLFICFESLLISTTLKDCLPPCFRYQSSLGMAISGFGIPAVMMIILAAVASDGFSDGNDNCWLDLQGSAMLPSVIPVIIFACTSCFLLLSVFDSDEPNEELSNQQKMRGRNFLKTRWACFAVFSLITVCYGTGMAGANDRNLILNYVFVGFSTALGILMPIIRIRSDDEVREQLKRGLFTNLRDDLGAIRVSPAPDRFEPNPLLEMSEFDYKYKQHQLQSMNHKRLMNNETIWHQ